jgi:DNA-binding LacI/PurR family transcriptional regulator/DNA-binding transcriptional regulator YhcF (GntR family)
MDLGIKIKRSKVVWRQVADQVRKKILTKQLLPGTKLPSTAQMAAQIGTDVPTLHRALTELVCEGLITRTPRIGTHVAQWEKGLLRLGVYHSRNILAHGGSVTHRVLEAEVQKAASALKISVQVWTDPRPASKQAEALPVVDYAARERIIQALISTDSDETHRKWFGKLPVPVAVLADSPTNPISFDHQNFFSVAVEALVKQGCRSAAFLCPFDQDSKWVTAFHAACAKAGLSTRPEWMQGAPDFQMTGNAQEPIAYQSLKRLWRQATRPEGLIVYPDVFSPGIVMAILEEHVRVPQDLKVVLHRHAEIKFFCPFESTFVTSNLAEAARAMINQLDTILKGREPKRVLLQHEVVRNPAAA